MRPKALRSSVAFPGIVSAVLRTLPACASVALVDAPVALAQAADPITLADGIPAQSLARALAAFAKQTNLQLVYVSELVDNRKSRAVPAGLGASQALARMLEGTGLRFEYLTPRTIRIVAAGPPKQAAATVPAGGEFEEVVVTANRREEDLQKVPITLQVMTGTTLARLNASTFDDFLTYLPGITAHGSGPGQNNIYVRGLATAANGSQSSGVLASFPNVAVYLDEQSVQLPNRNLDVYAADLERIEILEGPQGTLFGAGAEAGVMRYITNKPKLGHTEVLVNGGFATTANGDPSSDLDLTVNVPLIADRLAVRAVIYNEMRGGYIDNPHAIFAGGPSPQDVTLSNFNLAANDINSVTYQGMRVQALYRFNDEWDALIAQSNQTIRADGIFTEMVEAVPGEPLPPLSTQMYNPSQDRDRFSNTALTITGLFDELQLVYAGSYLDRNVDQVQDYTQYARGQFASYYQCVGSYFTAGPAKCFTPSSTWHDIERNTHLSQELRLSTPVIGRLRTIGGLFYEDYQIQEHVDWFYATAPYFQPIAPPTGYYTLNGSPYLPGGMLVPYFWPGAMLVPAAVTANDPNVRPPGEAFFNDITRGYVQRAAYASVDFQLLPDALTLTAGTRYSSTRTTEVGSSVGSSGCKGGAPNPCVNHSNFFNIDFQHLDKTYTRFTSRVNLSWQAAADVLLYYTWSQGFRAGGFNRGPMGPSADSPLSPGNNPWQAQAAQHGGYVASVDYAPDDLTNNELGWKTRLLDRRLQWNGALYQETWNQTQIPLYGIDVANMGAIANGGNYRVRGLETSVVARVIDGLTLEASAAWNHSELTKEATLYWRDGTPIDFSTLRNSNGEPFVSVNGPVGTPLAGAPPFQGNMRARYEFPLGGCAAFAQAGVVHQSHSYSSTFRLARDLQGATIVYDLPAFTTVDAALGVVKGPWLVQLYGENLTDTHAQLYAYYQQYKAVTVNRPRTIGLHFSYHFKDE